jgi:hypothetical protein
MAIATLSRPSRPAPLFYPYHRSHVIAELTVRERSAEYDRAELTRLCYESDQRNLVPDAVEGSRFRPDELVCMVKHFPQREQWLSVTLWQLLQLAIRAETDRPLCRNLSPVSPLKLKLLRKIVQREAAQKTLRAIATEAGVCHTSIYNFAGGGGLKRYTARILVEFYAAQLKQEIAAAADQPEYADLRHGYPAEMVRDALLRALNVKSIRAIAVETGVHRNSISGFLNGAKLHDATLRTFSKYFAKELKAAMMPAA